MEPTKNTKINQPEPLERCVMCGALTSIPVDMPIDWRENYEVGCGQLCAECAKKRRQQAVKEQLAAENIWRISRQK